MATYDTWGGSWGTSWAASWIREIQIEAEISGTIFGSTELDIQAGGKTIVITLTGDTWVAAGAPFDAIRQDILDGVSTTSGLLMLNQPVTAVVRDSDTVVTITLVADPAYDISTTDTGTVTVPGSATVIGSPILGAPTFDISPGAPPVVIVDSGGGGGGRRPRRRTTKEIVELGIDLTLREMHERVAPLAPAEAAEIVAPHVEREEIDWPALEADTQAARELISLYVETMEAKARQLADDAEEDELIFEFVRNEFR